VYERKKKAMDNFNSHLFHLKQCLFYVTISYIVTFNFYVETNVPSSKKFPLNIYYSLYCKCGEEI